MAYRKRNKFQEQKLQGGYLWFLEEFFIKKNLIHNYEARYKKGRIDVLTEIFEKGSTALDVKVNAINVNQTDDKVDLIKLRKKTSLLHMQIESDMSDYDDTVTESEVFDGEPLAAED